jgi:uncharacterized SAM-dependent methyltransferase
MNTVSNSTIKSLQQNYDHIRDLPIVQKLNKKISKLKMENKSLQRVILHFGKTLQNIDVVDLSCDTDELSEAPSLFEVVGEAYTNQDTKVIKLEHNDNVDIKMVEEYSDEEHISYNIE